MNRLFSIAFTLLVVVPSLGQLRPFQNDPNLSDNQGNPKTDSIFYWSANLFADSTGPYSSTYLIEWYSDFLSALDEPVLSNSYLGREIVRLTWLRSFHKKVVIRIENSNEKFSIYQKQIENIKPIEIEKNHFRWPRYNEVKLTYAVNTVNDLGRSTWEELMKLIEDSGFLGMPAYVPLYGTDGSRWILELHTAAGWHVVNRWTPDDKEEPKFRKVADFILNNSKFRKEERY